MFYDLLGQLMDPCSVSQEYWTTTSSAQSPHGSSSASDASPKHCDSSLKKETQELFPFNLLQNVISWFILIKLNYCIEQIHMTIIKWIY